MALNLTRTSWTTKLDRVLAAHERRARLIAQLHEQAIAIANDLSAQHKAVRANIAKDARRRKAEAWLTCQRA
jgi:acyl transferase domain-containing protein